MWILTTNYWAKVKIQRISYTSLQQILTKHKVKRRRNLGSRTTTKLLGFQIHEKKSLSPLCDNNGVFTIWIVHMGGSHRNIFDKALFKCLGRFSSKGELENSTHLRIRKINLYFCYVELGTNLNKFEQVLLCYIRMKDKYETSMTLFWFRLIHGRRVILFHCLTEKELSLVLYYYLVPPFVNFYLENPYLLRKCVNWQK